MNEIKDGLYEINVHITDVSSLVTEESIINEVAKQRIQSIYLDVNQKFFIPMLPFDIYFKAGSLNEGEERPAITLKFRMNDKGEVYINNKSIELTNIKSI